MYTEFELFLFWIARDLDNVYIYKYAIYEMSINNWQIKDIPKSPYFH